MRILALTGGTGCGKSTAAAVLREVGAPIIDADAISKGLTRDDGPALPALLSAFGQSIFSAPGRLNRPALAKLVFTDEDALRRLNAILHPMIRTEILRQTEALRQRGEALAVLDIPLLYEAHMEDLADLVLCMTAPLEVQLARVMERDGISREAAAKRVAAQLPTAEKAARADFVISSDRPQAETAAAVRLIYEKLRKGETA